MAASRTGTGGLGATRRAVADGEARPDGLLWPGHRRVGKDWWLWWAAKRSSAKSPHQRHPHCPTASPVPTLHSAGPTSAAARYQPTRAHAGQGTATQSQRAPSRASCGHGAARRLVPREPRQNQQSLYLCPLLKAAVVAAAGREVAVGIPVQTPGLLDGAGMRIIFKVGRLPSRAAAWSAQSHPPQPAPFAPPRPCPPAPALEPAPSCRPQGLTHSVESATEKGVTKRLLDDVSGYLQPAQMTAMVRPRPTAASRAHRLASARAGERPGRRLWSRLPSRRPCSFPTPT